MQFFLAIFVLYFASPSSSQSYPVFGTKRYHRSSNPAQMPIPASLVPNPSFYNSPPKYYYEQRPAAYAIPTYHETYPDDNPYYYYPRQEYFGMPIYHGDYKPSPYYYAHPPSYSYYDDREVANNPMDDLHEEILQEDERERQRELFPVEQDDWYQGEPSQQDELTNNFLKNLIAYNRQINAQEQHQIQQQQQLQKQQQIQQQQQQQLQQQEEEQMLLAQNEQRQHPDYQNDRPQPMYDDEYGDYASSEYEFVPEQPESYNKKKVNHMDHQHKEKHSEVEDENEKQLKLLALHQKSLPVQNKQVNQEPLPYWNQPAPVNSRHHPDQNKVQFADDEAGPDYEDDTWINWDRKRSANTEMKMFPQQPEEESILAFSNRKPTLFLSKGSSKGITTIPESTSETHFSSSTTIAPTSSTSKPKHTGVHSGQKEVVLPRPANSLPRSLFSKPLQDAAEESESNAISEPVEKVQQNVKPSVYDTIKHLITMRQQYQQNPSKLQKRFVSNEESLVHELESLKRRSV